MSMRPLNRIGAAAALCLLAGLAVAPAAVARERLVRPSDPEGRYMFGRTCWLVSAVW